MNRFWTCLLQSEPSGICKLHEIGIKASKKIYEYEKEIGIKGGKNSLCVVRQEYELLIM